MSVFDVAKNFAKGTVSTGYTNTDTTIVMTTGHGAHFSNAPFNVVWWNSTDFPDPSDDPNVEIVRVVVVSTDTFTVIRAQEGTTASTKNTSGKTYKMIAGVTALYANTSFKPLPNAKRCFTSQALVASTSVANGQCGPDVAVINGTVAVGTVPTGDTSIALIKGTTTAAGLQGANGTATAWGPGPNANYRYQTRSYVDTSTSVRVWIVMTDNAGSLTSALNVANPTGNTVGFRYSTVEGDNGTGNWRAFISKGTSGTTTVVDTGVTFDTTLTHKFEVFWDAASQIIHFYIDGTEVAVGASMTNIPTSSTMRFRWLNITYNQATQTVGHYWAYTYMEMDS